MKKYILKFIILSIFAIYSTELPAQILRGYKYGSAILKGDTIQTITMSDLHIIDIYKGKKKLSRKSKREARRYSRLVNAVLVTYPVAVEAGRTLRGMEKRLVTMTNEKDQKKYVKSVEDSLKREYFPFLRTISMYQGMVLLKLIDRETGDTSFKLIQELRGNFSAFFWQNLTRLFGGNLKVEYDKDGDDAMIESIIMKYYYGGGVP